MAPPDEDPARPLEPGPEAMRALGQAALELLASFVERRDAAPAADFAGADELARALRRPPPEEPIPAREALRRIDAAVAKGIDTAGPGFMAYIPGGGLFAAAVGELLAAGTNRYTGVAAVAPPMVAIEASVVDWLRELCGLPASGGGVLTSGGSLANLSAVLAARTRLGEGFSDGRLYASAEAHHSVAKAAMVAGFPPGAVREIACDAELRLDPAALERALADDRARGLRPCAVVATAGTTNTGAIDPLPEVAALAERAGAWLHVDAAYGGPFLLTERGRRRLAGVERADSVTLDPHKGLFLPYGTGCLLVRDAAALRAAHAVGAAYLHDQAGPSELPNFADGSTELSRRNRGLGLWLALHLHGVRAFRAALNEKLDLAELVWERLSALPELELPWRPRLTTVAFRVRAGDAASRAVLDEVNASGRVFLSSTEIAGRHVLRVSILSHRTHRERVEEACELIAAAARRAAAGG